MAVKCSRCGKEYVITLFEYGHTVDCDCGTVVDPFESAALELPVEGELDLHTFRPAEVKDLLRDYLGACAEKGIFRVRVVHGKGSGALLRTVHSILKKMPDVESFRMAREGEGGWGATIVDLNKHGEHSFSGKTRGGKIS